MDAMVEELLAEGIEKLLVASAPVVMEAIWKAISARLVASAPVVMDAISAYFWNTVVPVASCTAGIAVCAMLVSFLLGKVGYSYTCSIVKAMKDVVRAHSTLH